MKKLIVLIIIVIVIAAGFIIYEVRQAMATPDMETPTVIIEIDEGVAEVWPASGETWQKAKDGDTLVTGDRVRTLGNSKASIIFYDTSVTRLDENTEILIQEVNIDHDNYLNQDVEIELVLGRVWSRIISLLDLDSKFEVETSTVVATVRGTSFNMSVDERGETELDVIENLVDVTLFSVASGTEEVILDNPRKLKLEAGNYINLKAFKKLKQGEEVPDVFAIKASTMVAEKLRTQWFANNFTKDDDFAKRMEGIRRDRLRKYLRHLPGTGLFSLQRWGEKIGLALTGDSEKRNQLEQFYMARRLAEIAELAHQTKTGLATQELVQFENLLKSDGVEQTSRLQSILPNILFLYQGFWADVVPSSKSYRLKQKIEELALLGMITPEQGLYWKLMNLEERLREAERLIKVQELDLVTNVLDAARLGLENLKQEVLALPESEKKQILLDKIEHDLIKLKILQEQVQSMPHPESTEEGALELEELDELTGDEEPVATPEENVPAPVEEPPVEEKEPLVEEQKTVESLTVSAFPNPVYVNSSSDLSVRAYYTDGSSEDVTTRAEWQIFGDIGSVSNGIFNAASSAGSAQIQATFSSGGATKSASFTMNVKEHPAVLESIRLMATKIVMGYGETATLIVEANYSDGSSKDVSNLAGFTNSNPSVGELRGSSFYSYPYEGTTTITATYSESGATKTDVIVITVQGELL